MIFPWRGRDSGFGGIAERAGGDAELGEGFEVAPEG